LSLVGTLAAVEAAQAGSPDLDIAIAAALHLDAAPYSRSLDAALRLVPDGWSVAQISQRTDGRGRIAGWTADLFRPDLAVLPAAPPRLMPSAPLALAIAALRAHAVCPL
jgi:hypothetical protein